MVEIAPMNIDDPTAGFQVSVLLPFEDFGIDREVPVTYRQAKVFSQNYQREEVLPSDYYKLSRNDFLNLPAVKLINDQIDQYAQQKFRIAKLTNRIEIRANKDVTFKIINFVIEKCSSYDDLIPSLIFRTMFQQE